MKTSSVSKSEQTLYCTVKECERACFQVFFQDFTLKNNKDIPESIVEGLFSSYHTNINSTILPNTIVSQHLQNEKSTVLFYYTRVTLVEILIIYIIESQTSSTSSILMEKFLHHS